MYYLSVQKLERGGIRINCLGGSGGRVTLVFSFKAVRRHRHTTYPPVMFVFATTVALSFLGSLVNAQSTGDAALGIVAIEAHFTNAELSPQLLPTFVPSAVMNVTFSGVGAISPGQNLSKERECPFFFLPLQGKEKVADGRTIEVAAAPEITIVPANSSVSLAGNFTLLMADADVVGTKESVGQTRHWLVNGVTLKNGARNFFLVFLVLLTR